MQHRRLLGFATAFGLAALGCATTSATSDSGETAEVKGPPSTPLDFPYAYVGHGTRPGVIELIYGLDQGRIPAEDPPTMGVALWFRDEVPPSLRSELDAQRPAALAGPATWGSHFVYVSAPATVGDGPALDDLAAHLDAWIAQAHERAPLAFAIREGTGGSIELGSWHRQSLMAAPEHIFPALDRWLAEHAPGTAGPQGVAVARIMRTLLRSVDARQERWIRAHEDPRWVDGVARTVGHDLVADLENTSVITDADLPGSREQDSAFNGAFHVALTARGRPTMGDSITADLVPALLRKGALPEPWLAEAVGRMARGSARGRGPEAAAMIAHTCPEIPGCPAETFAAGIEWWSEAGKPEQAAEDLAQGRARWPDHPAWDRLAATLDVPAPAVRASEAP